MDCVKNLFVIKKSMKYKVKKKNKMKTPNVKISNKIFHLKYNYLKEKI